MLFFVSCIYLYVQKDLPVHLCWGGPQSLDLEEHSIQLTNENTPKYLVQSVKYSNRGIESKRSTQCMCLCAKGLQLCPTFCDSMDCGPPDSSVHGILQARVGDWVAIAYSGRSSWPRDQTYVSSVSCSGRQVLYRWAVREVFISFCVIWTPA